MITTSSGDLFKAALRKCSGVIAEGEEPSVELMEDTRLAFNIMIDSWSAERLSVFSTQEQVLTWPAGERIRTIGPSGNLVANRPVAVDDSTYFKDPASGISYGLKVINQEQYNKIALKTSTSSYPQVMWVNMDMPNVTAYLFPVPTRDIELHLCSVSELTQISDLFTSIILPPGYQRALIYNLALEICTELGLEPSKNVKRIANQAKRSIKAQNFPGDIMSIPTFLLGRVQRFNIYSGT